ncbi:outer membrane beta-barrel protein [Pseudocolwellia agarivorans]|uniref:outer membrane beta-barrel protein n=1 Tax=Pseudocolwellia agarivorans TaxID=1911682 RepID=UPI000984554C|nr:outer membrane beta-barrel protein [Pseudocolwellia agarivorans]
MTFFCKTFIGALTLFSFHAAANNTDKFDYLGLSLQHNSYDELNFSPQIDTSKLTPLDYSSSSSSIGFRGFVGHQFNRYIAMEAGVTSFGKGEFKVTEESTDSAGEVINNVLYSGTFKTLAGDIRAIGTYPLSDRLFLKAHVGILVWDNEFSYLSGNVSELNTQEVSDTGITLLTGLGIGYGFSKDFALSLDFEKTEIADITAQNISLSLLIRL